MNKKTMKKAFKNGYSPLDVAKMQAIAKHAAEDKMKEAKEEAFIDMLMIPCAVLAFDYWQKSAKKRIPDFVKEVVSLYESIEVGAVSRAEILQTFEELSGMKLEREWRKQRNETERNG